MSLMRHLASLMASRDQLQSAEERHLAEVEGTSWIADAVPRQQVTIAGKIVALTYQPRDAKPAVTARISDGTGVIALVFLGRRDVPGIGSGRRLVATGVVANRDGLPVIYNPRYELLPAAA